MAPAVVDVQYRPFWQDPSAHDPIGSGSQGVQPTDDLDALFDEQSDQNDTSRNINEDASSRQNARGVDRGRGGNSDDGLGLGLGIDDEVKVRKPRAPVARLDEDRLLSSNGISKLRRITKDRLKFRGKGHEFSDISRMLNTYQLWLDDLFPKAKFADGLAIIEKLGHKKRMQVMRREWIDEGKPQPEPEDPSGLDEAFVVEDRDVGSADAQAAQGEAHVFEQRQAHDEDIYAEPDTAPESHATAGTPSGETQGGDNAEPDLDELDQLLAEDVGTTGSHAARQPPLQDDYADDEDAMAEMW